MTNQNEKTSPSVLLLRLPSPPSVHFSQADQYICWLLNERLTSIYILKRKSTHQARMSPAPLSLGVVLGFFDSSQSQVSRAKLIGENSRSASFDCGDTALAGAVR